MLYVPNVVAEYGNIRTIAGVAPRHNAVTPSFFTIFFVVSKPFWNVNFPPSDWIWNSSFTLSIGAVENLDNAPAHAPAPNRSIVVGSLLKISFLCCTSSSFGGFLRTKRRNIFFFSRSVLLSLLHHAAMNNNVSLTVVIINAQEYDYYY
jgi:hypothetical protein